jgi:hypothetical protein
MRLQAVLIVAFKAILFCTSQTSAALLVRDTVDDIGERLNQGYDLSIETNLSDDGQTQVQFTSTLPVGSHTSMTMDAILGIGHGSEARVRTASFGFLYRPSTALLFGASVQAAESEQGFQGTFTSSTSWSAVVGDAFLSVSANANYSSETGWGFDGLASSEFSVGQDITGYAEVWLSGNRQASWGAALGVTLPLFSSSEIGFQIHRDFGDFPTHGFLAEYYGTLGDNGSLTISGAWDQDLITRSYDLTLTIDTELMLRNSVSLGLSGSSVIADGHILSSEAQLDVTFAREDRTFGLSASRSLGLYQNTTFSIEWASRW